MDALLTALAESSPVAAVGLFAIWRLSVVVIKLADALVESNKVSAGNFRDLVDKHFTP